MKLEKKGSNSSVTEESIHFANELLLTYCRACRKCKTK